MKNKLKKMLATALFAVSLIGLAGTTSVAQAGYGYGHKNCKMVGGYWRHGHFVPKHWVCWRSKHHCKWVGGYKKHGHWVPRHKVCW